MHRAALSGALMKGLVMPVFSVDTQAVADTAARTRTRIATIRSTHDYEQDGFSLGPTPAMLGRGIAHRIGHINDEILRLSRTARGEQMPNLAIVRANWQMFVSPTAWSWAPFFSVWGWKTPQMRHAIRAALAMGTGYAASINLPWGGLHDYWILLTIACPIVPYRLRDVLAGAGATDRRRALVLAAVGAVLLLAACALTTLTIGLVVNRIGGFYPTWSVAWENIGPAL